MGALSESFGRAASAYETHAPVQTAMASWLAEWLPEHRDGAALEIGAGTGLFTRHTQPWSGCYVATDASPGMVTQGRAQMGDVEWRRMNAERVEGGPWAWIFSSSMLQWVPEPAEVLRGWRDALAPGGRVLAGFYVADTLPELRPLLGDGGPLTWRSPEAWREAFVAADLRVRRDTVERRTFEYASARALLHTLHGVGAAPRRLVPPARLLGWLREQGERPMRATWTFHRCEAERS